MMKPNWRAALLGIAGAMMAVVVLTAGAAGLMARGTVDVGYMGYFAAGILVLSGLVGGLAAMVGGGGEIDAALAAVGELVVLFGLNAVLNGGEMEGIGVTVLAVAGGCGAAVLLRMNRGSGRRRRRRRR